MGIPPRPSLHVRPASGGCGVSVTSAGLGRHDAGVADAAVSGGPATFGAGRRALVARLATQFGLRVEVSAPTPSVGAMPSYTRQLPTKYGVLDVHVNDLGQGVSVTVDHRHAQVPVRSMPDPIAQSEQTALSRLLAAIQRS